MFPPEIFSLLFMSYKIIIPLVVMKKFIGFFFACTIIPAGIFAQNSSVFLGTPVLNSAEEAEVFFPHQFFSGNITAQYDTTLGTRILAAMNYTYTHDRINAR